MASCRRDHPRVCGEKKSFQTHGVFLPGSPPRMRGKANAVNHRVIVDGITPAYAGKSHVFVSEKLVPEDHPRVCGEKEPIRTVTTFNAGSPPRMRGKECDKPDLFFWIGITPAYAGKRLKRSRSTVSPVAIVPLFPSVCNKPVVSDGSPAVRDVPLFLPAENAVPASPACNLRSL